MDAWGPLAARFGKPAPVRRLLALDGGGIRGIITLHVLLELETQLRDSLEAGPEFRLCDAFDYIGGTSTGAIIAAGLARGMPVSELIGFYRETGPLMFDKRWLLARCKSLYRTEPLAEQLKARFGETTLLGSEQLRSLLLVVTRNSSTDSAWPVSSNPLAKYNAVGRKDCNLQIPLWQLVRASTAAPVFFPPEVLPWDRQDPNKTFVFQDGGMTPYNNPAFLLYRMATLPPYNLGWPASERQLMLVSVGTGTAPAIDGDATSPGRNIGATLMDLPSALMSGSKADQDINCRMIGRCVHGASIDSEIGDLIPREGGELVPLERGLGRAFLYARYDADLTQAGLAKLGLPDVEPQRVAALDAVDALDEMSRVGEAAAREVDVKRFGDLVLPGR
jgi:uncharacterized protein